MTLTAPLMNDGNIVDNGHTAANRTTASTHLEGSTSAVLHRSLHHDPLRVVSAKGNYLHVSNGQSILDATGGAAVACLGHGDERYDDNLSCSPEPDRVADRS